MLAALLLGTAPSAPLQPVAHDTTEPVIVELALGRLTTRTVPAYRLGGHALIPLVQFLDLAEIRVERATLGEVVARLEPGGVPFVVRTTDRSLTIGKTRRPLAAGELLATDTELFVDAAVLGEVLRLDWNLSWSELTLTVVDPRPLPIAQRVLRQWRQRTRDLGTDEEPGADRLLPAERRLWDGWVVDYSAYTPTGRRLADGAYSAALGLDLVGGSFTASFANQRRLDQTSIRSDIAWSGVWKDNRWLSQLRLGDGYSTGPRTRTLRGVSLGNTPYLRPNVLGAAAFTGDLGPGWQIEAFRGGRPIAFDSVNALGRFSIDAPIQYGDNPIDFVAYGPFGEVRRFSRTLRVDGDRLPSRRLEYGAALGACRSARCQATANVDVRYGLSPRWTLATGLDEFWRDTLPSLFHPYASLSGSLTNAVGVEAELVANAVARALVRFEPRTSMILTAEATRFARGVQAPLLTPEGRTSQFTLTGFFRPVDALGAFYFDGSLDLIKAGAQTTTSGRLGASYQRGALQLLPAVRWQRGGTAAGAGPQHTNFELSAFVLPAPALGPVFGAATSRILLETESSFDLSALGLAVSRNLNRGIRVEVGGGWSKLAGSNVSLSLQANLASVRSYTTVSRSAGQTGATQYLQGSVMYERASRRVSFGPGPSLERAGLTGRVFLDQNGNDRFDPGEPLLPNVRVSIGMETRTSDSKGEYRLWNVTPYERAVIAVDSTTLASPLWVPSIGRVAVEPGPNRFRVVDIPIAPGGVVEGRVERADGSPASGITLTLTDLKSGATRAVVSFSDGAFYTMGVKPGEYRLVVDQRIQERLGIQVEPIRFVLAAEADGATVSGIVVRLR